MARKKEMGYDFILSLFGYKLEDVLLKESIDAARMKLETTLGTFGYISLNDFITNTSSSVIVMPEKNTLRTNKDSQIIDAIEKLDNYRNDVINLFTLINAVPIERVRVLLIYKYVEEKSDSEICNLLNISNATRKRQLRISYLYLAGLLNMIVVKSEVEG